MAEKNVDEKITFYGTMSMWDKEEYKDRYKYANIFPTEEKYQEFLKSRNNPIDKNHFADYSNWDDEPIGAPYHEW